MYVFVFTTPALIYICTKLTAPTLMDCVICCPASLMCIQPSIKYIPYMYVSASVPHIQYTNIYIYNIYIIRSSICIRMLSTHFGKSDRAQQKNINLISQRHTQTHTETNRKNTVRSCLFLLNPHYRINLPANCFNNATHNCV